MEYLYKMIQPRLRKIHELLSYYLSIHVFFGYKQCCYFNTRYTSCQIYITNVVSMLFLLCFAVDVCRMGRCILDIVM